MFDLFEQQNPPNTLRIKVTPRARFERIKKEFGADGEVLYKVYVTAAAEGGKANAAAIKLLSNALGICKSNLSIAHGHSSREKIIKIDN